MKMIKKICNLLILTICFSFAANVSIVMAEDLAPISGISPVPAINFNINTPDNPQSLVTTLQILFTLASITLIPYMLLMLTCFTRIIIALHFIRAALGTQQMPPNQLLISLALFLTMFLMGPIFVEINESAIQPFQQGLINQQEAMETGMRPLREFMFKQVENKDMALFAELANMTFTAEQTLDDIPNRILIPAFMLGEMTKGFQFGFIVYLPFIAMDMIVASTLMAMGMMMLPPAMISLPFKILLFILVDGWSLIIENLIRTFR